jgi:Zn-dependent peptidase ImmA (M78 family)
MQMRDATMTKRIVPYLSEEVIEKDADSLLAGFYEARKCKPKLPIPIEDIVEKYLKLSIDFDDMHRILDISKTGAGAEPDVLGAIFLHDSRVMIDESLDPEANPEQEGRYRFTLAHEGGGHWRLHRHLFLRKSPQADVLGRPLGPDIICRSTQARERIEFQADYHASCLLMPRKMVIAAWGILRGTKKPFVYDPAHHGVNVYRHGRPGLRPIAQIIRNMVQPDYIPTFDAIARPFCPLFGVSLQAMRIRLEQLGLLLPEAPRQQQSIEPVT